MRLSGTLAWFGMLVITPGVLQGADVIKQTNRLGPVAVTTTLRPEEPQIGDEIQLEIQVESPPQVEILMPEFGEALERYTIVDFVPKKSVADDGNTTQLQRYTLQPYLSGDQFIPPILIEFVDHRPGQTPAPKDRDAYELLTDRIDFTVKSVLPTTASQDLKPPLGKLDLEQPVLRRYRWWIAGGTLMLVVALIAVVLIWRGHRRRERWESAYEVARRRLDGLLAKPPPQTVAAVEAYFVAISAIVRRYLEDRFELHAPELTTEEFLQIAQQAAALTDQHRELLRDFLQRADLVKFAGIKATDGEVRRAAELAGQFLEETRHDAPLIPVAEEPPVAGVQMESHS